MDNFAEQIVTRKKTASYGMKCTGTIIGGVLLILIFLVLTIAISPIMLMGAACMIYLMWFLISSYTIEYEYIITNNDFDIDRITGRQKRKRLITLKLNKTLEFGPYDNSKGGDFDVTVDAHDNRGENLWYLISEHDKHGKTLLLFTPSQKILFSINDGVPSYAKNPEVTKARYETDTVEPNAEKLAIEALLNPIAARESEYEKTEKRQI